MDIEGKIANDCQTAKDLFSRFESQDLTYDEDSIASLDDFINRNREVFDDATIQRMIMIFGAFLGEAVRRNIGGRWEEINGEVGIRFGEKDAVFPFSKVRKHFENGGEDSILSFYQVIPMIFKFPHN